jgi:hypothetical protein
MNFTFLAGVIITSKVETKYNFYTDAMLFIFVTDSLELSCHTKFQSASVAPVLEIHMSVRLAETKE